MKSRGILLCLLTAAYLSGVGSASASIPGQREYGPGWTLFSTPGDMGESFGALFGGGLIEVLAFSEGRYVKKPLSLSPKRGKGYWLYLQKPVSLPDSSAKPKDGETFTLWLERGWNLIGVPFPASENGGIVPARPEDEALLNDGLFFAYDPAEGSYRNVDFKEEPMLAGGAYWLRGEGNAALILRSEVSDLTENQPPYAEAGEGRSVPPDTIVVLDGSESFDPNGDIVSYRWSLKSGPVSFPDAVEGKKAEWRLVETGEYVFMLEVEDSTGLTAVDSTRITVCNVACAEDSVCEDGNAMTLDACAAPGTCQSVCTRAVCSPRCMRHADCSDGLAETEDVCDGPGTCGAACRNDRVYCEIEAAGLSGAPGESVAVNVRAVNEGASPLRCGVKARPRAGESGPAWFSFADGLFVEAAPGETAEAAILTTIKPAWGALDGLTERHYELVPADESGEEWGGGADLTVAASCSAPACSEDAACDDGNPGTGDACLEPGTCSARCLNASEPACANDATCDDGDPNTADSCVNPGGFASYCSNQACLIACNDDAGCNDGDASTFDSCSNPGACGAECLNLNVPCASNDDCFDQDLATIDRCANAGTPQAECKHGACSPACGSDADCDDGAAGTTDSCVNPGTCWAACSALCVASCRDDLDCNDYDPKTDDRCAVEDGCAPVCLHEPNGHCEQDADCDDGLDATLDFCEAKSYRSSVCRHETVRCWADADCDDEEPATLDYCRNPGTGNAACLNVERAVDVAAGQGQSCVVYESGKVACLGVNDVFQAGIAETVSCENGVCVAVEPKSSVESFAFVPGISNAAHVEAGDFHTCALLKNGGVKCWGRNWEGQLGDGTSEYRKNAVEVKGLHDAISIVTGDRHSCALTREGRVACWGWNRSGQLGPAIYSSYSVRPVFVENLEGVTALAAGDDFNCAVLADGTVRCWGWNEYGQLGAGETYEDYEEVNYPVRVVGIDNAVSVIAGSVEACALLSDGHVKCWGWAERGQLGTYFEGEISREPVLIPGVEGAEELTMGAWTICARTREGATVCWGDNSYYQMGQGPDLVMGMSGFPMEVPGLGKTKSFGGRDFHTCAVMEDGGVKCWGWQYWKDDLDWMYKAYPAPVDFHLIDENSGRLPLLRKAGGAGETETSDPSQWPQ